MYGFVQAVAEKGRDQGPNGQLFPLLISSWTPVLSLFLRLSELSKDDSSPGAPSYVYDKN